jgi:hypothetical protein
LLKPGLKCKLSILESKLDILRIMVDELLEFVDIPQFKIPQFEITDNLSPSDVAIKVREF